MKYYINNQEVSERIFDRDAEDNFNAGIRYVISEHDGNLYMEYTED